MTRRGLIDNPVFSRFHAGLDQDVTPVTGLQVDWRSGFPCVHAPQIISIQGDLVQIMSFNRESYGFTESGIDQTPALHFATFHGDDGNELPVDGNTAMRARPGILI